MNLQTKQVASNGAELHTGLGSAVINSDHNEVLPTFIEILYQFVRLSSDGKAVSEV